MAPHLPIGKPVPLESDNDTLLENIELQSYYTNKLDISIFKSKMRTSKGNTDMLKYRKKHQT